jgi:phosphatidylserine/phosphatidylglycerophosphate/cardiolipin synthase-like enzyme
LLYLKSQESQVETKPLPINFQEEKVNTDSIAEWLESWKHVKKLDFSLENKHFFLDGSDVDELTKDLIALSEDSIDVVNPFIEGCYLTEAILRARERNITVRIVTRPIKKDLSVNGCHAELLSRGVQIKFNNQIHSKIVIVDNKITIVSSMNFTSGSSGGGSFEAGITSIDPKVIAEASKYMQRLLEKPDFEKPIIKAENTKDQYSNSVESTGNQISFGNVIDERFLISTKQKPNRAGKKWTT